MPYRRDDYFRAIQTKIGEALRKQQTLSEPLPERLAQLLDELDAGLSEWLRERGTPVSGGSGI
jgi:Anti-sigma factor NepR